MDGIQRSPVILCILDGLGEDAQPLRDASARTPVLDRLIGEGPLIRLGGGGVGKPPGLGDVFEMLGTGRLPQPSRGEIDAAVGGGSFARNETIQLLVRTALFHEVRWHVLAALSESHTALDHLAALLDLAEVNHIPVVVHAVAGMDPAPRAAQDRLQVLESLIGGRGTIGTLSGSEYAGDAENRWDRTYLAFHAMVRDVVLGPAAPVAESWFEALRGAYGERLQDREIRPVRLGDYTGVRGDFTCDFAAAHPRWEWLGEEIGLDAGYRGDGFGQLLAMLTHRGLPDDVAEQYLVDRGKPVRAFDSGRCFTLAGAGGPGIPSAFSGAPSAGSLVETAARAGLAVFRCGEVSRRAWMTRRLDGNRDQVWAGEERFFPDPVRDPATGHRNAGMCAYRIAERAAGAATGGRFDLVIADLPELAVTTADPGTRDWVWAVEGLDEALGDLVAAAERCGGTLVLVAPPAGEEPTGWGLVRFPGGETAVPAASGTWIDLAPTLLSLLGVEASPEMDGRSLLG